MTWRVLCIEDEPALQELYTEVLAELDCQVLLAATPPSRAELLALAPDLLLLDLVLGGEDRGWDYLLAVRLDRATRHLPILVCSAAIEVLTRRGPDLVHLGVPVLPKPFDLDAFMRQIRQLLPAAKPPGRPAHGPATRPSAAAGPGPRPAGRAPGS